MQKVNGEMRVRERCVRERKRERERRCVGRGLCLRLKD